MVSDPHTVGGLYAEAGARRIIGHVEAFANPESVFAAFAAWKAVGAEYVGLAIKIDTPLSVVEQYVDECDSLLLMTIATIGAQGQLFDLRGLERIRTLRKQFPSNITAKMFSFTEYPYWEVPADAKTAPKVNFGK